MLPRRYWWGQGGAAGDETTAAVRSETGIATDDSVLGYPVVFGATLVGMIAQTMRDSPIGDPRDPLVFSGPLVNAAQFDKVLLRDPGRKFCGAGHLDPNAARRLPPRATTGVSDLTTFVSLTAAGRPTIFSAITQPGFRRSSA